jgi:hypothetical protein
MVEMVDSQQKQLEVNDIVAIDGMNTDAEYDTRTLMAALTAELNMPNTLFLRQGNTLYVIHKVEPRVGYFRMMNADTPNNFLENGVEFIKACYKMGFDTMATKINNPDMLSLFRYMMEESPNPDMGYRAEESQDGRLLVTIKCGPEREA